MKVPDALLSSEAVMNSALIPGPGPFVTPLAEGPSVIVDVEEFQYTYKCKHCGHQWSEKREKESIEKV